MFLSYLTCTGWAADFIGFTVESSNTGLSIEYVDGGGDLDLFILVSRFIRLTVLFSLRSFDYYTKRYLKEIYVLKNLRGI